jgi:ABC-type glycerol-3-phosphate transport system permease component
MALVVVSTLPIILIYPFLQKYMSQGMLLGAIKG